MLSPGISFEGGERIVLASVPTHATMQRQRRERGEAQTPRLDAQAYRAGQRNHGILIVGVTCVHVH